MRWDRTARAAGLTPIHVPAPVGGINTAEPGGSMPATDAVLANNVVANEFGLRSRLGYQDHYDGIGAAVRTIVPFAGATAAGDKLFAVMPSGIKDVTSSGTGATLSVAFGTTTGLAGYGISTVMVTAGGHFGFLADEANGLYRYDEAGAFTTAGTWQAVASGTGSGEISGINPANAVFAMVWKNRLWLVERDTATAYYLPVGAVAGVATPFYFGNKFRSGGHLVGLWNWTGDGGAGMDDHLVAVSSAGDVVIYAGTDPDSAIDFAMRGDWFVGALPAGRRIATDFGGELLLLTQLGILPISKLTTGQAVNPAVYSTRKINGTFARLMSNRGSQPGWSLRLSPKDQAIIVTVPDGDLYTDQLAQSVNTGGWATFTGLPMVCNEVWQGDLYFGTPVGVVAKSTGGLDGVTRTGDTSSADQVVASGLTAYQTLGSAKRKQVTTIRPHFRAEGIAPGYGVAARYDFDPSPDAPTSSTIQLTSGWDIGLWDAALWNEGGFQAYGNLRGAHGIGSSVAIQYSWTSMVQTTLIGFDVAVRECGIY